MPGSLQAAHGILTAPEQRARLVPLVLPEPCPVPAQILFILQHPTAPCYSCPVSRLCGRTSCTPSQSAVVAMQEVMCNYYYKKSTMHLTLLEGCVTTYHRGDRVP